MTSVKWGVATTVNIGDYSNISYECSVQDDLRTGETIQQASDRVFRFVEEELDAKITASREELTTNVQALTEQAKRVR